MANNERAELSRRPDETFDDFALRLYANSRQYGVNCYRIADILNEESGLHKAENSWRIRYKDFRRGMEYQKFNDDQEAKIGERILCISDLHYPFHLPLDTFTDYADRVDTLVLNGDLLDCMALSRFQKSFRISPIEEMVGCRQYIIDLIRLLKPARVIATNGNHEYRLSSYINKNVDCEIKELMPDSPLEYLFEDGFTHYDKANSAKTFYPPLKEVSGHRFPVYPRMDVPIRQHYLLSPESLLERYSQNVRKSPPVVQEQRQHLRHPRHGAHTSYRNVQNRRHHALRTGLLL